MEPTPSDPSPEVPAAAPVRRNSDDPATPVERVSLRFEGGLIAAPIHAGTVTLYRMNGETPEPVVTLDERTLDTLRAMTAFGRRRAV